MPEIWHEIFGEALLRLKCLSEQHYGVCWAFLMFASCLLRTAAQACHFHTAYLVCSHTGIMFMCVNQRTLATYSAISKKITKNGDDDDGFPFVFEKEIPCFRCT